MEEAKGLKSPSEPVMDSSASDLVSMDTTPMKEPKDEDDAPVALLEFLIDITAKGEPKAEEKPAVAPVAPGASNGLIATTTMVEPKKTVQKLDESSLAPVPMKKPKVDAKPDETPMAPAPNTKPMKEPKSDANPEKAPVAPLQAVAVAITHITAIDKLRRFCYIGNTEVAVYLFSSNEKVTKEKFTELLVLCAEIGAQQLADCLVDVLINNDDYLPRRDEALFVLAVYLSTCTNTLERALLRKYFPRLVRRDTELFMFTQFVKQVQILQGRKTPFSRTIRKAVMEWYQDKSSAVLLQMWAKNEKICSFHKDLLRRCHYMNVEMIPEIKATLRLLSTPTKELGSWPEFLNPLVECKKQIESIIKLRKTKTAQEALPVLKELSLTYDQVPDHLRSDPALAEFLIPMISYEQLLKTSPRVLRLSKRKAKVSYIKYQEQLLNQTKMKAANIAPLRILLETMRLHKHKGETSAISPKRPNFLYNVYAASFGHNKALGKRLHITLNLEKLYLGKCLNGRHRSINYLDALVALAFGFYKTDTNNSKVNYWSDRTGKLKALPWTKEMTVVEATECCKTQLVQKTKQVLAEVMISALEDKNTYDVFLIVVPGATRGNPNNSANRLAALLEKYSEERKCNAKLIIVSLRQSHKSMEYSTVLKQNVLELCGVSEYTPQIINAFASAKFH
ncbi:uncharacterized protein LOC6599319 isoform X2 [Drosophila persimilis]|uniref:uncharacterized protein LOC6599319 isoform X2 n=1 Tax=Drosophila persimilis TaxID=7234 RepID=UPI000F09261C|nr:uncharacterized protein LOC6599319 isoform X2 [Drosophila persimilis]